jgi:hypothetical protein
MGLPPSPFSKGEAPYRRGTTTPKMDYFRMPRPLCRKLKKYLPKPRKRQSAKGGRPRASERAVADAQIGTCFGQDANGRL